MTKVKRVSLRQMVNETGMADALGYSKPDKDTILIRKDLPKDLEKTVMAHEADHMQRGEEGPFLGGLISAGLSLFGGRQKAAQEQKAAERAAKVADPFGQYRSPFQEMLLNLYGFKVTSPGTEGRSVGIGEQLWGGIGHSVGKLFGSEGAKGSIIESGTSDPLNIMGGEDPSYIPGTGPTIERMAPGEGGGMADYFKNLPGYQFALSEMLRSTTRAGAATGGIRSGKLLGEITQRVGGLAEQTYNSELDRLMTLAGANRGSPATAGSALLEGGTAAAKSQAAGLSGAAQSLGYGVGGGGNQGFLTGEQNAGGGGYTTWGNKYVDKGYGPVISLSDYKG